MSSRSGKILSFIISLPVHFYRYAISPYFSPACRHVPSCSQYMLDALKLHGPLHGLAMGLNRILRCRPGGTHGYDPVPLFRIRKYKPVNSMLRTWKSENRLKR
jgi:putative membrane protein insertion efficiency factor